MIFLHDSSPPSQYFCIFFRGDDEFFYHFSLVERITSFFFVHLVVPTTKSYLVNGFDVQKKKNVRERSVTGRHAKASRRAESHKLLPSNPPTMCPLLSPPAAFRDQPFLFYFFCVLEENFWSKCKRPRRPSGSPFQNFVSRRAHFDRWSSPFLIVPHYFHHAPFDF